MTPFSIIDVASVRADTPGVEHVLHLNNAGAALPGRPLMTAVLARLNLEANIGGYEAAECATPRLKRGESCIENSHSA